MPTEYLWSLVVSLIVLAIGTSIHAATNALKLQMANNEHSTLLAELRSLDKGYNEKVSSISQLHKAEIAKISISHEKEIENTINKFHNKKTPISSLLAGMGYYNNKIT